MLLIFTKKKKQRRFLSVCIPIVIIDFVIYCIISFEFVVTSHDFEGFVIFSKHLHINGAGRERRKTSTAHNRETDRKTK